MQLISIATQPHVGGVVLEPRSIGSITDWLILDVHAVLHGQIWRLLTYAFLHSTESWFHLLFNMLFLWWFGSDIEQLYGSKEYLILYLLSAFLGGVAFELSGLTQNGPMYCLGASGAVTTMLVLCALHFPKRVIYLFMMVPIPIWLFAILNVAQDAFVFAAGSRNFDGSRSNVAVIVHLAGAAFAVAYYKWQGRLVDVAGKLLWWKNVRSRARLKLFNPELEREEPVAVSATSAPSAVVDEYLEAKLDAVLEKIARTGKESLTPKEQEILKQAADMYKRRRN